MTARVSSVRSRNLVPGVKGTAMVSTPTTRAPGHIVNNMSNTCTNSTACGMTILWPKGLLLQNYWSVCRLGLFESLLTCVI